MLSPEGRSTNKIPLVLANYIAERTGLELYDGIYKATKNDMTSKKKPNRLLEKIEFAFLDGFGNNDIDGKRFVVLDDVVTTGTTVKALAKYIESMGGVVEGYISRARGQDSMTDLAVTEENIERLKGEFGEENVKEAIRERWKYESISELTNDQARAILANPKKYGLRRMDAGGSGQNAQRMAGGSRSGKREIRGGAPGGTGKKDSNATGNIRSASREGKTGTAAEAGITDGAINETAGQDTKPQTVQPKIYCKNGIKKRAFAS